MDKDRVLASLHLALTSPRKAAGATVSTYLIRASQYLGFLKDRDMDTRSVREYLALLDKKGQSAASRRIAFYVLKKLFKANGVPWEFERGDLPEIGVQVQPAFTISEIETIIKTRDSYNDRQRAFLVMATIYGLRASEIQSLTKSDFAENSNFQPNVLVRTRKKGEWRVHLIPDEIRSYLEGWNWYPSSHTEVHLDMMHIRVLSGLDPNLDKYQGYGWHAVRRALATALESNSNLSPFMVWNFLRWKVSSKAAMAGLSSMMGRYFVAAPEDVDKAIFKEHPFLRYWR